MKNSKKRLMGMLISASVITTQLLIPGTAFAQSTDGNRLGGSDRDATNREIVNSYWNSSDYAVIARDDVFADSLSAGPLAKAYDAPIILTDPNKLSDETLKELKDLHVKTVFIAGGTGAISQAVEDSLKSNLIEVKQRFAGSTRYETSQQIADAVFAAKGKITSVAVATGDNFPDALSIASIAASNGFPILLTDGKTISDSAKKYIADKGVIAPYIIGGTGVVSSAIEEDIDGISINGNKAKAIRLAGPDRYATNAAVLNQFKDLIDSSKIYLAVGANFPDSLSGAPLAAQTNSPIVLVPEINDSSAITQGILRTFAKLNTKIIALGGTGVIPDVVLSAAETLKSATSTSPELSGISLTDDKNNTINGVIDGNKIIFTIPSASTTIKDGNATLNENISSAIITGPMLGTISYSTTVKPSDSNTFVTTILKLAKTGDSITVAGIKAKLNNSTLALRDENGFNRVYTIVIK